MVSVLVPTDDARAHQGYCCSIRRLNRYCRAVDRRAGGNRISFVLKTFGQAARGAVHTVCGHLHHARPFHRQHRAHRTELSIPLSDYGTMSAFGT